MPVDITTLRKNRRYIHPVSAQFYLEREEKQQLVRLAAKRGVSVSDLIRPWVQRGLQEEGES